MWFGFSSKELIVQQGNVKLQEKSTGDRYGVGKTSMKR